MKDYRELRVFPKICYAPEGAFMWGRKPKEVFGVHIGLHHGA